MCGISRKPTARRCTWGHRGAFVALLLGAMLTACDVFDATNPTAVTEEDLTNPAVQEALVFGVMGLYDRANLWVVRHTGLLSEELIGAGSWETYHQASRQGVIINDVPTPQQIPRDLWNSLHPTRHLAEETYERLQESLPNPETNEKVAIVRLYAGLAYLDFAELFCAATYAGGPAVQPEESYGLAQDRLEDAIRIAEAAGADTTAAMARLARARIWLARGDFEAARGDAASIPEGFRWEARYASREGETNELFPALNQQRHATVHANFHTIDDPRIPVEEAGALGPDGATPIWNQLKYTLGSNIALGTWQEARLIEAEAHLMANELDHAVQRINEVRTVAGLDPISGPVDEGEVWAALRHERKAELFLEGSHHYVDRRRWGLLPEGWATCIPIVIDEVQSNPNL